VDIFWTVLVAFTFVTAFAEAFRPGADGPSWDLHWRSLDAEGRARVVSAANSREDRAKFTDPEDVALLDGYIRFKRRRRSYVDLAGSSFLVVLAAFALAGLVGTSEFGFVATFFLLAAAAWEYLSEKHMNGRLRAVVAAETSTGR
jgi:hypothetical protein